MCFERAKNTNDLVTMIRDQKDLQSDFETSYMPKEISSTVKGLEVKIVTQLQQIKMNVDREIQMEGNVTNICNLVKG